jgi:hypothetical protein
VNDLFTSTQTVTAYRLSWKFIQRARRAYLPVPIPECLKSNRTHAWIDATHPAAGELREHARYLADPGQYDREQALITPADMTIGRAASLAFQRPETLTVEVTQ